MRRAGQKRLVSLHTTPVTPPAGSLRSSLVAELEFDEASTSIIDSQTADTRISTDTARCPVEPDVRTERHRHLEIAIRQRIESRLPGRVRDLVVRFFGDTVLLEGQCATYYTKQLAQHAALGILEDEHLENAIIVNVQQ